MRRLLAIAFLVAGCATPSPSVTAAPTPSIAIAHASMPPDASSHPVTPDPTAEPTPVPPSPTVVKGRRSQNTKPFDLAAGDYAVTFTGTGDGNVVLYLHQRGGDVDELLVNEIKDGRFRYDTTVYAVPPGSFYLEVSANAWQVRFTPLP